jgi:hypothetical protein
MSLLITLVVVLIVVGVGLYLVNLLQISPTIKQAINAIVIAATVIYLLLYFVAPLLHSTRHFG